MGLMGQSRNQETYLGTIAAGDRPEAHTSLGEREETEDMHDHTDERALD